VGKLGRNVIPGP